MRRLWVAMMLAVGACAERAARLKVNTQADAHGLASCVCQGRSFITRPLASQCDPVMSHMLV
jgi:hypothetical protein